MKAHMNSRTPFCAVAAAFALALPAMAGEMVELAVPANIGAAVEPAHRAHHVSDGAGPGFRLQPAQLAWIVTEAPKRRVLLPAEEKLLLAEFEAERLEAAAASAAAAAAVAPASAWVATVYFPYNGVKPLRAVDLADVARQLNVESHSEVLLEGHADRAGKADYNLDLSVRRARSISASLVRLGVAGDRLSVIGFGESEADASDAAQSRRVDISTKARAQ